MNSVELNEYKGRRITHPDRTRDRCGHPPIGIKVFNCRDEIVDEATKAFAGYDTNGDGMLSQSELNGRGGSRSAMGGFLKRHSKEIDRDGDSILTRAEAVGNPERLFAKMDANGDGKITPEEMEWARR